MGRIQVIGQISIFGNIDPLPVATSSNEATKQPVKRKKKAFDHPSFFRLEEIDGKPVYLPSNQSSKDFKWQPLRTYLFAPHAKKGKKNPAHTNLQEHYDNAANLARRYLSAYLNEEMAYDLAIDIVWRSIDHIDKKLFASGEMKYGYNYYGYLSFAIRNRIIDEQRRLSSMEPIEIKEIDEEQDDTDYTGQFYVFVKTYYPKHLVLVQHALKCFSFDPATRRFKPVTRSAYIRDKFNAECERLSLDCKEAKMKIADIITSALPLDHCIDNHDGTFYHVARAAMGMKCTVTYIHDKECKHHVGTADNFSKAIKLIKRHKNG